MAAGRKLALFFAAWALIGLQTLLVTPLLFVFAETLPKDLFRTHTDRWTYRLAPVILPVPGDRTVRHRQLIGGEGQIAAGRYLLSSSHDGQKWFPWLPGKSWATDGAEGVSSYYSD